jgi:asparagine N-glycosylation enzyme membrane subunit Stt3
MITMTIFEMMIRSFLIFLSILVPGYLVFLALLKRTGKFNFIELLLIGVPFGMFLPSFLALIEFTVGITFSPLLAVVNIFIITIAALAYLIKEKIEILPKIDSKTFSLENSSLIYGIVLLVILFLSWWVRIQSLTPYYYDFDPYWYNMATQFIIQQGYIPPTDDYTWYPNPDSHRTYPLIPYMEAGWYHLFTLTNNFPQFNFELMTMISGLYPPIIATLTVFFAYLWISREYNKMLGVLTAALLAFTPVFIAKTGAGSFEFTPFGFFGIIAYAALLSLTLKEKSKEISIAAGFILAISAFGSGSSLLTPLLFAGVTGWVALSSYSRGKSLKEYIDLITPQVISMIITEAVLFLYFFQVKNYGMLINPIGIVLGAYIVALIFNELNKIAKTKEDKLLYLSAIIVLGIAALIFTPANTIVNAVLGMIGYVATNPDVTMKTIAEQTGAPSDFSGSLGVLGFNLVFSITPIIIILSFIALAIKFIDYLLNSKEKNELKEADILLAIAALIPIAAAGLLKAKYVVFMGVTTPIAFMFLVGELTKVKMKTIVNGIILIVSIMAIIQILQYSDTFAKSISLSNIDVVDNTAYYANVCNPIGKEIQSLTSNSSQFLSPVLADWKIKTYQVYCSRIPDSWLDAMLWIRENVNGSDDRIMSWWDYGHWTNTIGQSKSVTGNTHSYTIMHQEVADKIVGNSTEKLISYMKDHKAKYLLLDQDLIGKWGALVYHYCNYNNETTVNKQPGESLCDLVSAPEYLYIPTNPTSSDYCKLKNSAGQRGLKIYSSFGSVYGFDHYCLLSNDLPLYYENGSAAGIKDMIYQGTGRQAMVFIARYDSTNPDRKGRFYNSIFYQGFFEGNIPGLTQVYPSTYSNKPTIPVRIYKINE